MAKATTKEQVQIEAPKFDEVAIKIIGASPYVQNKFSAKAREEIKRTQEAGSTAKGKKKREPKNFKECYDQACHKTVDGWYGIPAPAFRTAMISACRIVGYTMTRAKLALFVVADGEDADDHTPLVKITKGQPKYFEGPVRNASGVIDLRARPMWEPGWEAIVRIRYDSDMFTMSDVLNLMLRVGQQVGLGEGRHDSRDSCGMGWGEFVIQEKAMKDAA